MQGALPDSAAAWPEDWVLDDGSRVTVRPIRPEDAAIEQAFVRGLSMRDIEALCEEAGLGSLSKATASRICEELRERFERFKRRDLYGVGLVALFFRRGVPRGPPGRAEGRRPRRVGIQRGRRTRAAVGDARDARVP